MADKIKRSYKFSKNFYDDALTQNRWWSRLYFKLFLGGVFLWSSGGKQQKGAKRSFLLAGECAIIGTISLPKKCCP